jgi:hypothetical protein
MERTPSYDFDEMEMRPCIPITSGYKPAKPFDCYHFIDPEGGDPSTTWDVINVSMPEYSERVAKHLGTTDPDELTRRLDALAKRLGWHVLDVFIGISDDDGMWPSLEEALKGPVPAPLGPEAQADLDLINRHRHSLGMDALDPVQAEWGESDLAIEAERIRRLQNPMAIKERLLRY